MDKEKSERQWYVLQVGTGMESDIRKKLEAKGITAAVPMENRVIRKSGKWIIKNYVIFPGYVFICTKYDWATYYILAGISGIVRILGNGYAPIPLSDAETDLIVKTAELFRVPSSVRFYDGRYEIISGALKNLQQSIKKIDRHARRALIEMDIAGKKTKFTLSFMTEKTNADG